MKPIKYETALLLREKILSHNFSIYGEYAYCLNTNELVRYIQNNTFAVADKNIFYPDNDKHYFTPAPFQEEVIEWLWEKQKIFIEIYIKKYGVICTSYDAKVSIKHFNQGVFSKIELKENFDNRNEAMEQGIIEALKLIN